MQERRWHVIKTMSRAEKKVAERIQNLGIETYLPLLQTIKQWSDRKKKVAVPLIPSTLFAFCSKEELEKIYLTQGFSSILYYLGKPAVVRDFEIENLKILLKEKDEFLSINEGIYPKGVTVEVIRGPLQGLIATSVEDSRTPKLIVEIEGLEQKFLVHVPKSFVRKLN